MRTGLTDLTSHGTPRKRWRDLHVDIKVRIMHRVEVQINGCWIWTGTTNRAGYGHLHVGNNKLKYAHRVSYEAFIGPIPDGFVIDHLCKVPSCVNPGHLEAVTQRENVMRSQGVGAINARKTRCPNGHPYDSLTSLGRRRCSTCHKAAVANWKVKQ